MTTASPRRCGALQLPHTLLEVTRRSGSQVEVRRSIDPVHQAFLDAQPVEPDQELPEMVAQTVVPLMCRSGIEAACMQVVRRRRLARGERHAEVEDLLSGVRGTAGLMSLALFDDPHRGGEVRARIRNQWGANFELVYEDCNRGSHRGFHGSLRELVEEARGLAGRVAAL